MIHVLNPVPPNRNQKPDLCAATCLQMALDRRNIEYGPSLESLALRLGLYIDQENIGSFGKELQERALPRSDPRVGLVLTGLKDQKMQKRIKDNFGLETRVYMISKIGDERALAKFIAENIDADNDIIMNYWLGGFNGRPDGHYVSVFGFNENTNKIIASDPSPTIPEYWGGDLSKFHQAMMPIWRERDDISRERGLIILSGPTYHKKEDPLEINKLIESIGEYNPPWTELKTISAVPASPIKLL